MGLSMRLATVVLAGVITAAPRAASQSTWCRYQARQLSEIMAQHDEDFRQDSRDTGLPGLHFTADQFPSRAVVVRGDSIQSITHDHKRLIEQYFSQFIRRPVPDDVFQHEVLFLEERDSLWLPIQESLIPGLVSEAAPGDSVIVFAVWLGALTTAAGDIDWVFTVNEFGTSRSAAHWATTLADCPK